ncbi:sulfurtransferase [Cycloclasticus sp. 46_83_sub15_T18]|nr:sulfurtransferase [Cycloclasticus sp. 46_83_sub15_T18]
MDIYIEFISNHSLLFVALVIVIILLLQTVFSDITRKFKLLSPSLAVALINRDDTVVIDTRNKNEFDKGHLSGAILIPLPEITEHPDKLKKYDGQSLLFYCQTGSRSNEAGQLLSKQGFDNIFTLDGGIQAWQEANLPLEKK